MGRARVCAAQLAGHNAPHIGTWTALAMGTMPLLAALLPMWTAATALPYDFTSFEQQWPRWVELFASGTGAGEFSWLPTQSRKLGQGTSLYGTTDLVYASFAVGQLAALTDAERDGWAKVINKFQNKTTGWFVTTLACHSVNPYHCVLTLRHFHGQVRPI